MEFGRKGTFFVMLSVIALLNWNTDVLDNWTLNIPGASSMAQFQGGIEMDLVPRMHIVADLRRENDDVQRSQSAAV